ncbi:L-histidine N(alpha)-methyltransferase [Bradyrhizobium sp. USDA 4529]
MLEKRTTTKNRPNREILRRVMLLCQNNRQLHLQDVDPAFGDDVLQGLSAEPRAIPARWLYDARGSALFEAITAPPECYPTRIERAILSSAVGEIAARIGLIAQ